MPHDHGGLPHDFVDRVIRTALHQGDNLRALVRAVAPEVADHLDYSQLETVPAKYLLDDWRQRESDVLIRLPYRDEAGARCLVICVLVEHQSTTDPAMPLRLLLCAVLFWEQEWKAWTDHHERGQPLCLTPVLPVVLYTGQEPWDTNRQLPDLFDVPEAWKPWLPSWPMPLWDLTDHGADELLGSQEPWWQALAVARRSGAGRRVYEDFPGGVAAVGACGSGVQGGAGRNW